MSNETAQPSATLHFLDYWRVIRSRKEIVLAVAILVVLTGTVYTLMLPNIYAAQVRISVSEGAPEINPFSGGGYNPTTCPTTPISCAPNSKSCNPSRSSTRW